MNAATLRRAGRLPAVLALLLVLVTAGAIVTDARPAMAEGTGNMLPPFDVGQTWNICRGYGYASHTGTSLYGIDLTGSGCDNSAAGRNVRAPIDGTVAYYQASYGNLCVNIAGNRSFTLTHINSSITSGSVTAGQLVGTVAAAQPDPNLPPHNNNLAHIHFQIWAAQNLLQQFGHPLRHRARCTHLRSTGSDRNRSRWWQRNVEWYVVHRRKLR